MAATRLGNAEAALEAARELQARNDFVELISRLARESLDEVYLSF